MTLGSFLKLVRVSLQSSLEGAERVFRNAAPVVTQQTEDSPLAAVRGECLNLQTWPTSSPSRHRLSQSSSLARQVRTDHKSTVVLFYFISSFKQYFTITLWNFYRSWQKKLAERRHRRPSTDWTRHWRHENQKNFRLACKRRDCSCSAIECVEVWILHRLWKVATDVLLFLRVCVSSSLASRLDQSSTTSSFSSSALKSYLMTPKT